MPNKDRSFHESPQRAGGEGWLYPEQHQKLCHFKPDTATVHAQWVGNAIGFGTLCRGPVAFDVADLELPVLHPHCFQLRWT